MARSIALALALGLSGGIVTSAAAKVFYSREEALRVAFPDADTIEKLTFFLTAEQTRAVEALARSRLESKLESKLVTVHVGKRNEKVLGYAMIDIHVVRTMPEASMIVLSPDGNVESTLVLAFHEPLEYLPSARWLKQFDKKSLNPGLGVGQEIAGITGATLTAYAITESVRRALAIYRVLIAPKSP